MSNIIHVETTSDYGIFKKIPGNRDLNRSHMRTMCESLQKNNFLHTHPIMIDKDGYVIDGQHRLEAAKRLGLEVHYFITDEDREASLIESNVNVRRWEKTDFLNLHAEGHNNDNYIELKLLLDETKLKPKALFNLILDNVNAEINREIKRGKFQFSNRIMTYDLVEFYTRLRNYTNEKKIKPYGMFKSNYFTQAFRWIYKTDGFDVDIFFNKLDNKWYELKPQTSSVEWYKVLLSIFNYKNKHVIEQQFGIPEVRVKKGSNSKKPDTQMSLFKH